MSLWGGKRGRREDREDEDRPAYLRSYLCSTDQLPRPSLVALPGPVVAPGANVSLRCAGHMPGMSFALYRVGVATPLQYVDSVQPWADFPLIGVHALAPTIAITTRPPPPMFCRCSASHWSSAPKVRCSASSPSDPGDPET